VHDTPLPLLCVGDAPPASIQYRAGPVQGAALGIFAAYAIGDLLCRDDDTGLKRYQRFIADEFSGYRKTLRAYTQWSSVGPIACSGSGVSQIRLARSTRQSRWHSPSD
jgi:hypothetical protein